MGVFNQLRLTNRWSQSLTVAMLQIVAAKAAAVKETKHGSRKDRRGVDLISDALTFGRLRYVGPVADTPSTAADHMMP